MQQNENENQNEKSLNRANDAKLPIQTQPFKKNCSICNSGIVEHIHQWRADHTFNEIVERSKKEFNIDITKDSLSRHFQHYTLDLQRESAVALWDKFQMDVESVSSHQKKVLFISNIAFQHILERLENGTLTLGIDDFEKMVKLYYSVLRDPDSAGDQNIIQIFQRASEKYGCGIEQGVLIKKKSPPEGGLGGD